MPPPNDQTLPPATMGELWAPVVVFQDAVGAADVGVTARSPSLQGT